MILIDMDDTIFEYRNKWIDERLRLGIEWPQSRKGFFEELKPLPRAVEAVNSLRERFDVFICTRPSAHNIHCFTEKAESILKHFDLDLLCKTIMTPDKTIIDADYLIDDCMWEGFKGTQVLFGSPEFPDWDSVLVYFDKQ